MTDDVRIPDAIEAIIASGSPADLQAAATNLDTGTNFSARPPTNLDAGASFSAVSSTNLDTGASFLAPILAPASSFVDFSPPDSSPCRGSWQASKALVSDSNPKDRPEGRRFPPDSTPRTTKFWGLSRLILGFETPTTQIPGLPYGCGTEDAQAPARPWMIWPATAGRGRGKVTSRRAAVAP